MISGKSMKRIAHVIVVVVAIVYFLIDAIFLALVGPLVGWIERRAIFPRVRAWIVSRGAYTSLALFLVPLILLEPVKPVGLYLIGTRHPAAGILVIAIGELIKLTMLERLFQLSKDKLLSFRWFRWSHDRVVGWIAFVKALPPWQMVLRRYREIRATGRRLAAWLR